MSKHTPGPWSIDNPKKGHVCISAPESRFWDLAKVVWQNDCDAELGQPSPQEEANARLIAAAPELLEALESLLDECEGTVMQTSANHSIERARAAIAKATATP